MNLGHLESFLAVADSGSLTAAARMLFITQPAISHHVRALEEYLGVRLFVRHKKGMLLTVEGEELRGVCRNVVSAAGEISFQVQQINQLKRGRLTIALTSFLSNALTPAFCAFKNKYPGVRLNLLFNNTQGVITCMKEAQADLGFSSIVTTLPPPVIAIPAHREELILVAPGGHPLCTKETVSPKDLQPYLFVLREMGTFTRKHTEEWFRGAPLPANTIETSRADSVRGLILAGAVGIMPEHTVRDDIAERKMVILPAAGLQSWVECSLYAQGVRPLSSAAKIFLDIACQERCLSRSDDLRAWLEAQD